MTSTRTAQAPKRVGRAVLRGLADLRPIEGAKRALAAERAPAPAGAPAAARVYAFASADYPGATTSLIFDSNATSAVGAFIYDPSSSTTPARAFTFTEGAY